MKIRVIELFIGCNFILNLLLKNQFHSFNWVKKEY